MALFWSHDGMSNVQSYPIILQIVLVVPSILFIYHISQGHRVTLTIAAIFGNGNKLIFLNKILVCSQNQPVMVTLVCMQLLLCDLRLSRNC